MIISSPDQLSSTPIFYKIGNFFNLKYIYIKLEGLNISGSIKLKTANSLINNLELNEGIVPSKNTIIESSSGNLGIALSIVCKAKGYKFICVTDPNTLPRAEQYMKLYGAKILKVTDRDQSGGYLATRINTIKELLKKDKNMVWTNQYASFYNIHAHYNTTAKETISEFPQLDYFFIGAGTTGTLGGCAKYCKENSPKTKIIAVDTIGSVTFGFKPSPRFIPGIGTSRRPEICSTDNVFDILLVDEKNAIFMCNYVLKKYGLFLGGSTASVLYAIKEYASKIPYGAKVVGISADFGEKYIDTIYNTDWVKEKFGIETCERAFNE